MTAAGDSLLDAFRRDHAVLGRGLHALAVALRGANLVAAKRMAMQVDRDAGPHIAFEQQHFYPRLRGLLGDEEVDRLYSEHRTGQSAVARLLAMPDAAWPDKAQMAGLLGDIELMERHIAECGELFGAMGRIPADEQTALFEALEALRETAPLWTELAPLEQSS